ncbi:GYF domain protein [Necator americanus]|uniref:GYF domain protein n=1 Tax=Necator americanus TaxID=51031 RepID=W2TXN9_NECAM|nr:GYF domain protein [Necator americanus]ETN85806.1 GYF domain protein [Necator americanus]
MVDWEFSYLDAKGNFRGPFTAKEMRKWFGRGFFHADLEVFVHRGHLAEKTTVGELCIINGEKTPFTFACLPVQPIIHRGFVEFPPGVTIKPKGAEAAESSSVTNSDVMPANSSAGETVKELNVTLAEAKKARSWPLLAPPDKKYPRTKKKIWIQQQFLDLRSQFRRADLTKFDKVKENQDLCGAVCKLCCVRLAAPSDVLRHLTVEDHQKKVENECQILGTEFDDYKKRLQVIVSSSTAASTKVSSTPSLAKPVTTKTITSSVAANSSKAGSAPTSSRTTNLSNVTSKGFVISTASKASAVPTDKEFATRMEELRALAVKIDTQKFVKIFKDRMSNNFCTLCSVRTDGPTTFLAHFVSQKHCSKMLTSGLPKATEDDFGLWKSQILAAVK